ncbi:NlpC/P60 family protein [Tsukamurella asaccharolytica]|uniref:NlpC/P60 family protein n=1 Tax=Tsukamurella asaccharolytica TaxID=2592067 RepID=A0A5C5RE77_9ACTN|nr:C40 family peptidase [Tsukamurella asaccharolytica]TWS20435.1 NlpC/P60 family protein [Tsukamurella asaccharolytica]
MRRTLATAVLSTLMLALVVAPPVQAAGVEAAIARGMTLVGTDTFGEYGCEDFVDFAYGRTVATGIPHDSARSFYANLAAKGLGHSSLPAPRGALVFSQSDYGYHVDISLGDGTYLSGGVQGLSAGWGDGSQIQVIPEPDIAPNSSVLGWAYAPWK